MNIPKVHSVIPAEGYILIVNFSDGTRRIYDAIRLINRPRFTLLKNEAFFRNVSVEPGGYAIYWNDEIDISEFELWQNGREIL